MATTEAHAGTRGGVTSTQAVDTNIENEKNVLASAIDAKKSKKWIGEEFIKRAKELEDLYKLKNYPPKRVEKLENILVDIDKEQAARFFKEYKNNQIG